MARSLLAALAALIVMVSPVTAGPSWPETIPLPDGFQPEGIAIGNGTTFYVGSIPTGAIYSGDIRTGEGDILVPSQEGRQAIGVEFDSRGRLWVAGGPTGKAFMYDSTTGANLAEYQLTTGNAFINDVVVTKDAAFFTDSPNPVLYRLPLGPGGSLPTEVQTLPLGGDYTHVPDAFNLNGIHATADGGALIAVQSANGNVYTIDPSTGIASLIDLGGESLTQGDGILLDGRTLYVVRNRQNRIAVVELSPDLTSGEVTRYITHDQFDVPTTIAEHGKALYAVNAKFGRTDGEDDYEAVRVPRG